MEDTSLTCVSFLHRLEEITSVLFSFLAKILAEIHLTEIL